MKLVSNIWMLDGEFYCFVWVQPTSEINRFLPGVHQLIFYALYKSQSKELSRLVLCLLLFYTKRLLAFCPIFDWTENALIGNLKYPNCNPNNYELNYKSYNKRIWVGKLQIIWMKNFMWFLKLLVTSWLYGRTISYLTMHLLNWSIFACVFTKIIFTFLSCTKTFMV